jgi:hypothetical protein
MVFSLVARDGLAISELLEAVDAGWHVSLSPSLL